MDPARCGQFRVLQKPKLRSRPYLHIQTPATCSNVALHNLFPGEIDLVVSVSGVAQTPHQTSLIRSDFWAELWGEHIL